MQSFSNSATVKVQFVPVGRNRREWMWKARDEDSNTISISGQRFESLTHLEVLAKDLQVMDASAISLARENKIPILVFSIHTAGAFAEVMAGRGKFTIITEEG